MPCLYERFCVLDSNNSGSLSPQEFAGYVHFKYFIQSFYWIICWAFYCQVLYRQLADGQAPLSATGNLQIWGPPTPDRKLSSRLPICSTKLAVFCFTLGFHGSLGMFLSRFSDACRFSSNTMTPFFISRVFEEHASARPESSMSEEDESYPHSSLEMSLEDFSDFVLAWENRASQRWESNISSQSLIRDTRALSLRWSSSREKAHSPCSKTYQSAL